MAFRRLSRWHRRTASRRLFLPQAQPATLNQHAKNPSEKTHISHTLQAWENIACAKRQGYSSDVAENSATSGFAARVLRRRTAPRKRFFCSRYGELCAGGFGLPVPSYRSANLCTARYLSFCSVEMTSSLTVKKERHHVKENHPRSAGCSQTSQYR